jgi:hypothetical protein
MVEASSQIFTSEELNLIAEGKYQIKVKIE